jgi:hypothetical protein
VLLIPVVMKKAATLSPQLMLIALNFFVYIFTIICYRLYDLYFSTWWFHSAYIMNIAAIVLTLRLVISQITECLVVPDDKIEIRKMFQPLFSVLALLAIGFTFIIHCDQWYVPQPFTGGTVSIVLASTFLMLISTAIGIYTGCYEGLKFPTLKIKSILQIPFHLLKH